MKKKCQAATALSLYRTSSGFGLVAASDNGIVAHHLPLGTTTEAAAMELAAALYPLAKESALTREAADLLVRYFAWEPVQFHLPLDLEGFTPFQVSVYRTVAQIPYGTVLSYREVACACGSPGAARAIGGAMARNPMPILIPCHRVVGSGGVMTGFTAPGGVTLKRELLMMEGVNFDILGEVVRPVSAGLCTGFPPGSSAN